MLVYNIVYFVAICYTHSVSIWYIYPVLVCCTEKNLAYPVL
jgi:hypothetical protein